MQLTRLLELVNAQIYAPCCSSSSTPLRFVFLSILSFTIYPGTLIYVNYTCIIVPWFEEACIHRIELRNSQGKLNGHMSGNIILYINGRPFLLRNCCPRRQCASAVLELLAVCRTSFSVQTSRSKPTFRKAELTIPFDRHVLQHRDEHSHRLHWSRASVARTSFPSVPQGYRDTQDHYSEREYRLDGWPC